MNLANPVGNPNLRGAWGNAQQIISGALGPGFLGVLAGIGIIMILFAVAKFFWDKRRGNGGNSKGMWFLIGAGAILAAPEVLMPWLLGIVDWVIMGIGQIIGFFTGRIF